MEIVGCVVTASVSGAVCANNLEVVCLEIEFTTSAVINCKGVMCLSSETIYLHTSVRFYVTSCKSM